MKENIIKRCRTCYKQFESKTNKLFCCCDCYKKERNKLKRERWKDDKDYARLETIRTLYNAEVAKAHAHKTKCEICGFERKGHYPQLHHIIYKCNGGQDTPENILAVCYYCHKDIHMQDKYKDLE